MDFNLLTNNIALDYKTKLFYFPNKNYLLNDCAFYILNFLIKVALDNLFFIDKIY
jgi:hypothetical protein